MSPDPWFMLWKTRRKVEKTTITWSGFVLKPGEEQKLTAQRKETHKSKPASKGSHSGFTQRDSRHLVEDTGSNQEPWESLKFHSLQAGDWQSPFTFTYDEIETHQIPVPYRCWKSEAISILKWLPSDNTLNPNSPKSGRMDSEDPQLWRDLCSAP